MLKEMKQQFIRETIIAETKKQLLEKGIRKTTIRGIADGLGIAVGNLYYYFKTKADIGDVIWADFTNAYLNEFQEKLIIPEIQNKSGLDKIRYYYAELYEYFKENPLYAELIAFLMGEKPRSERAPKEIREIADAARISIKTTLVELYEEGIADGSIQAEIQDLIQEVWSFNISNVFLVVNIIRYNEINKNIYEYYVNTYFNRLAISAN